MNQPLFFAPKLEKIAGYKLPANPRLWQAEIIRYLKSQHSYLPLDSAEIDIRRMDANKGAAVGSVILGKEIAIPIIISRKKPGADPELAPLDVFFHAGEYRYLTPDSIKGLTHSPQIGEPEKGPKSRAVGGNPYIGDVTGDATPLEYSGQASPFGGPFDGAKTAALDTKMKEKMRDRAAASSVLFGLTGGLRGIYSGATTKGLSGGKARAGAAAAKGLHDMLLGSAVGGVAGAASPIVQKGLGLDKKEKKEQRAVIKKVIKKELEKSSSWDPESGITAGLLKHSFLDPNDVQNFRQILATNPHILQGSGSNHELIEMVQKRGPNSAMIRGRKTVGPNMVQIFKGPAGGIFIKFSGGPEQKSSESEIKSLFGDKFQEIMSKLRSGKVYMQQDGIQRASWNAVRPRGEARQITSDGLYSVRLKGREDIVGMVCPQMIHFDGRTLPLRLLVSPSGQYAISGEMFGVRLSGKHRIQSGAPAPGQTGVFINYVHGTPIATPPLKMISKGSVKSGTEMRPVYEVQDPMAGERFSLSPVEGVQGFEKMRVIDNTNEDAYGSPNVYYMPASSEWVPLREKVAVIGAESDLEKISSYEPHVHISFDGGLFHMDCDFEKNAFVAGAAKFLGQGVRQLKGWSGKTDAMVQGVKATYKKGGIGGVAQKFAPGAAVAGGVGLAGYGGYKALGGGGSSQNINIKQGNLHDFEARELLVSMGMTQDDADSTMKLARHRDGYDRGVKIAGLLPPQAHGEYLIKEKEFDESTIKFAESCRTGLLKEAADSGHPETLDAILSLEFVTPQNVKYFLDKIQDFEEAASGLAALLVASRLGLKHVDEQSTKDALAGLSKTIEKLKVLRSAMEHKSAM